MAQTNATKWLSELLKAGIQWSYMPGNCILGQDNQSKEQYQWMKMYDIPLKKKEAWE